MTKRIAAYEIGGKSRNPTLMTSHVELQTIQSVNHAIGTPQPTCGRQLRFQNARLSFIRRRIEKRSFRSCGLIVFARERRALDNCYTRVGRTPLARPIRRPLFVEGGNPFARFARFAGLHVILERKIDILFYRTPPEFFD